MDKLSELIKGRLNNHSLSASAKSAEVIYFANKLLANSLESEAANVKAYKLDGGVLYVNVKNASLGQEVWGIHESILENLRKRFGEKTVKKIRIKNCI